MKKNQIILETIQSRYKQGRKSIAVLIDPDKVFDGSRLEQVIQIANENYVDFFFVGGSLITNNALPKVIRLLKERSNIPVVLFPGSNMHIDNQADGLLLLNLISGRNPDLLIGQHVTAAPILKKSGLEIIPTGYMLIDGGITTAVVYMSNTIPIPADKYTIASSTAIAGEMLGKKLIYMDAGSGAKNSISPKMIASVRKSIDIPLIVGGGINSSTKALNAFNAGADVVVIGNAIEKDPNLLIEVSNAIYDLNKTLDIH